MNSKNGTVNPEVTSAEFVEVSETKRTCYNGFACAVSPDDARRIEYRDLELRMMDVNTGKVIRALQRFGIPRGASFTSDGCRFAIGDDEVRIFDTYSGDLIYDLNMEPRGRSYAVEFTPDGNDLVVTRYHQALLYHRERPEQWWGVFCLPEFCLAILFACTSFLSWLGDT